MKVIFIDTNIFLHFKNFIELNWLDICQSEFCKLAIAPIVIEELDKYKSSNDERGKRARSVLEKIEEKFETNNLTIRKNVNLCPLLNNPSKKTFETYGLDNEWQDNQLIASIIEYKKLNPEEDVYLCTDDIGPRLRSKQFDFKIIKMSKDYLLPLKETTLEKKIKSLTKENELLKSRMPRPLLVFSNQEDFIKIKVSAKENNKESFINEQIIKLKQELPYMKIPDKDEKYLNPLATLSSLNLIPEEDINTYNLKLDNYYKKYSKYLSKLFDHQQTQDLSIKLNLAITNTGNTPCEDADIFCHFPDGFELIESSEIEDPPKKPSPPSTPKSIFENISSPMIDIGSIMRGINHPISADVGNIKTNRPSIRKTNSYEVRFTKNYVKHLIVYPLDELLLIYKHYSDMRNFSIDYRIIAGNVPEPIVGKLNVILKDNKAS